MSNEEKTDLFKEAEEIKATAPLLPSLIPAHDPLVKVIWPEKF